MNKKINKKTTTKKSVKKSVTKKTETNKDDNFGSSGILILGVIGIIVLIYFGANTDVESENRTKTEVKTEKNATDQAQQSSIMIDGLIYPSKEYALKKLKDVPQTQLTEEQRAFVINPDGFTK